MTLPLESFDDRQQSPSFDRSTAELLQQTVRCIARSEQPLPQGTLQTELPNLPNANIDANGAIYFFQGEGPSAPPFFPGAVGSAGTPEQSDGAASGAVDGQAGARLAGTDFLTYTIAADDKESGQTDQPADNRQGGQPGKPAANTSIGSSVEYAGRAYKVIGQTSAGLLILRAKEPRMNAVLSQSIAPEELARDYEEVKLKSGNSYYVRRGHPEHGVFFVHQSLGGLMLMPDEACVVAPPDSVRAPREQVAKPKPKPEAARPEPEEKPRQWWRPPSTPEVVIQAKVGGDDVEIVTPKDNPARRDYRIKGAGTFPLINPDGDWTESGEWKPGTWWYGGDAITYGDSSPVKLHVTTTDRADVAEVQRRLIPLLDQLRREGYITGYKTLDPNFADENFRKGSKSEPCGNGQLSKGFTIYIHPLQAEYVQRMIEQQLRDIPLPPGLETGNVADQLRSQSESRRVSLERCNWPKTRGPNRGEYGALLDDEISKAFLKKARRGEYGPDALTQEGQLTERGLREIEKKAGLQEGQLQFDKDGRLMFASTDASSRRYAESERNIYYASEVNASSEFGKRTGRPAIYALYAEAGEEFRDPSQLSLESARYAARREAERLGRTAAGELGGSAAPGALVVDGYEQQPDGRWRKRRSVLGEAQEELRRARLTDEEIRQLRAARDEFSQRAREGKLTEVERRQLEAMERALLAADGSMGRAAQEDARASMGKVLRGIGLAAGAAALAAAALKWYNSTTMADDIPVPPRVSTR